ncbi:chemokine XC receptor 1-like [Alosa sapidissima]|uniref:chemokine XC receptor 1-like n=1 Tax=Alosa sapidissima TaxID=34773 RepID=UPI001C0A1E51|nr:chemokine XC receptor 1-like [Alosa sapidissima]
MNTTDMDSYDEFLEFLEEYGNYSDGSNPKYVTSEFVTQCQKADVVHFGAKQRRKAYAISSSVVVWVVSLASSVKEMILHDTFTDKQYGELCENVGYDHDTLTKWKLFGYYQQFFVFFLIPVAIVLYCYMRITMRVLSTRMREKCRAVKLIFVIVLTFFINI